MSDLTGGDGYDTEAGSRTPPSNSHKAAQRMYDGETALVDNGEGRWLSVTHRFADGANGYDGSRYFIVCVKDPNADQSDTEEAVSPSVDGEIIPNAFFDDLVESGLIWDETPPSHVVDVFEQMDCFTEEV